MRRVKLTTTIFFLASANYGQVHLAKASGPDRVLGDTIIVFPGETLFFNAKFEGKKIIGFKEIKPAKDSTNTLIVSLDENNPEHLPDVPSMLTVYNPFPKKLYYKTKVLYLKKNESGYVKENVLPVPPKKPFWGIWPDQAASVVLFDFVLKQD